jgi:hypothetical protein
MSEQTNAGDGTAQTASPTTPERPGDRPKRSTNQRADGSRVDAAERSREGSRPPADA